MIFVGGIFLIIKIGLITLAFEKLGISANAIFILLLLTLLGSAVDIPIKRIAGERMKAGQVVDFFDWRFRVPAAVEKRPAMR